MPRHRFVISYYWELPVRKYSGFAGKVLNGWAVSGITTYQTGFPIRITSSADNELMNSFDFDYPGEPDQLAPFTGRVRRATATTTSIRTASPRMHRRSTGAVLPGRLQVLISLLGRIGTAPRTICCGPGISDTDFVVIKNISRQRDERTSNSEARSSIFSTTPSSTTRTATAPTAPSSARSRRRKTRGWYNLL